MAPTRTRRLLLLALVAGAMAGLAPSAMAADFSGARARQLVRGAFEARYGDRFQLQTLSCRRRGRANFRCVYQAIKPSRATYRGWATVRGRRSLPPLVRLGGPQPTVDEPTGTTPQAVLPTAPTAPAPTAPALPPHAYTWADGDSLARAALAKTAYSLISYVYCAKPDGAPASPVGQTEVCKWDAATQSGTYQHRTGQITVSFPESGEPSVAIDVFVTGSDLNVAIQQKVTAELHPGGTAFSMCYASPDDLKGQTVTCSYTAFGPLGTMGEWDGQATAVVAANGDFSISLGPESYTPASGGGSGSGGSSYTWIPGYSVPGFYVPGYSAGGYYVPGFYVPGYYVPGFYV